MRSNIKLATTIVYISAMASVAIGNAHACSCSLASAERDGPQTTIIFKGIATEGPTDITQEAGYYKFSPTKIYKGDQGKPITIYSPKNTCGQFFQKNTEYMVFAYNNKGTLTTSICRSWPISARYSANTKEVEEYFDKNK
ncbi:hypothetical protein [Acidovorax kalamii]|uniref:hypothetical protein n=1 Tax=Acidovorax kalamii TaxID=2004485 RepID=UPI0013FD838C|nr:hypothetical protein [Acidovorax kalamii]